MQVSPQLEDSAMFKVEAALSGMTCMGVQTAQTHWHKADAYYFMSIARMQRLWEVNRLCSALYFYFGLDRVGVRVIATHTRRNLTVGSRVYILPDQPV